MEKEATFLLAILVVISLVGTARAAPAEWPVGQGGNGHFYEAIAVPHAITWFQAYQAASLAGGYLVTITSEEEEGFVEKQIDDDVCWSPNGKYGPWIGAYQLPGSPEPDGGWQWVTGERLTYTKWGQDQPNDSWGTEHCIHLASYNSERTLIIWNDLTPNVTNIYGYVVEFERCDALLGDLNHDCRVDLFDFAIMADNWLIDCNLADALEKLPEECIARQPMTF